MQFDAIPGLTPLKEKLTASVREGKMPHAQLFAGKPGALNLPLALAYAAYVHGHNKSDTDPVWSKSLKYIHPDTHFVFPVGNVKGDKDDDRFKADLLKMWRSFLLEQPFGNLDDWSAYYGGEDKQPIISREESRAIIRSLSLKPFESSYKVMIIWQPELMHPSAANGILKILEEPPAHTYFLLVTNAIEKLLPTIVSRTQIVQVPMLTDDELRHYLQQKQVSEAESSKIVQLAEGNLNMALKLMGAEEAHHTERFTDWMRACFKKDFRHLLTLTDEFHEADKMQQRHFLDYSLALLRETLLHRAGAEKINRARGSELKFIQDFSKVMTVEKIDAASRHVTEASYFLERNGSAKMIFFDLSLQLARTLNP
jgi:DNA polymerase-3 subunit delta'